MRLSSATAIALETAPGASHARIEHAARELETQFAQMLIKSMRSASPGDPMLGDNTTYREMYDQQLARELSKGRGLGLAPMIVRELERSTPAGPATDAKAPASFPLPAAAPLPLSVSAGALPLAPSNSGVSLPAVDLPASAGVRGSDAAYAAGTTLDCSSPEAFVQSIWPLAQKTAGELGVPARALVAQAALETGWGRRLVRNDGVASHNLFGIKADSRWNGPRMSADTHEFTAGVRHGERADFRAYVSVADSFSDYARVLGNERYAAARGTGEDVHRFANALQQAGYATDPAYAAKLTAIANGATVNRALAMLPGTGPTAVATTATTATPRG